MNLADIIQSANSPESVAFHNHLFGCPDCNGRKRRYCQQGRELWVAYDAPKRAQQIADEPSIHRRRYLLSLVPEWELETVRALAAEMWEQKKIDAINNR